MKSYTDIEQSKQLAEILPIESADMYWFNRHIDLTEAKYEVFVIKSYAVTFDNNEIIPCWSLAALLNVLESEIDGDEGETYQLNIEKDGTWWDVWYKEKYDEANPIETASSEDLVDVCYKMILTLHEQKLL